MLALVLTILLRQFATAAPALCQPNTPTPSPTLLLPLSPHTNIPMAENDYSADIKNIKRFEYLSTMPLTPVNPQLPMAGWILDCNINVPTRFLGTQR